ncbi:MAG: protein kinase [Sandaracinaceae bacterium]
MFKPGERIDDVEIIARLRAGGMAALYLARREGAGGFSKELAIKVIHPHLASDKSFVEMFVDEARLSARIDHPNVVRVEALKEFDGAYCLLMEFVHGCSLSQLMGTLKDRKLRFSPELAVAIAIRVADGLHAAHELVNPDGTAAGVVHRDVSPANVLIGYRGDVKLIDFGIAKASQRLHQTEAAGLKGKIAYMAPEQAFGRDVDRRCDVYALGIVLWEMMTMRRLFKADNDLRLLDMVRDPRVVPPGAIVPNIPPALDKVILEALGRDRDSRPASAREFRYRLLDALPAAAAVDPLQISAVVCDVMSEKIAEDREVLSLSSFNSLSLASAQDSVTVSRLLRPVDENVEVDLDAVANDATNLAEGLPTPHGRPEPPTLLAGSPWTEPPPSAAVPRRRALPAILGAAAAIGIVIGGGAAGLLFVDAGASADGTGFAQPPRDEAPEVVPASTPLAGATPTAEVGPSTTTVAPTPAEPPADVVAVTPQPTEPEEIAVAPADPPPAGTHGSGRRRSRTHNRRGEFTPSSLNGTPSTPASTPSSTPTHTPSGTSGRTQRGITVQPI